GLSPLAHFAATGDRRFLDHPENAGRESQPHPILGGMALKVVQEENPCTRSGRAYSEEDLEFFWSKLQVLSTRLCPSHAQALQNHVPSNALRRAVKTIADGGRVMTMTGRLRAAAKYTARHNTIFQGLAADGAKLALWKLWRADFRIVNFIHDEVLVEVP